MCCIFYQSITFPFKTEDYGIYFTIWSQAALVFEKQTFVQPCMLRHGIHILK